jgi:2,3-bisphosphoglycerate-dependent phosphoglycerate mutase
MSLYRLVVLRHGESLWNKENRFTGWTDVDLSPAGIAEAGRAGSYLKEAGFTFDLAYTSVLKRAIRTLWLTQESMDLMWIPTVKSWRLNERHYGALQGLNKAETANQYGEEQVKKWRRSFDLLPPLLGENDPHHPKNDPRYAQIPKAPAGESLATTIERLMPFWQETIAPSVLGGKNVLIVAHGNSLRGLAMHLEGLSSQQIMELNIPTGVPLVYELDQKLSVKNRYYLGDPEKVAEAQKAVAQQGKTK